MAHARWLQHGRSRCRDCFGERSHAENHDLPAFAPRAGVFMHGTDDPIVPYGGGSYKPGRFHVLSAEDSAKTWAKFDRCEEKPAEAKLPSLEKGGKETKIFTFNGCQENAQVVLYALKAAATRGPAASNTCPRKRSVRPAMPSTPTRRSGVSWLQRKSRAKAAPENSASSTPDAIAHPDKTWQSSARSSIRLHIPE